MRPMSFSTATMTKVPQFSDDRSEQRVMMEALKDRLDTYNPDPVL